MTRRLIEDWLPIAALGEESVRERRSMTALPPTYYLHVWWARRPLIASRAAVLASLLPSDADHEKFLHMLGIHGDPVAAKRRIEQATRDGIRLGADAYGYTRAFSYLPSREELEWLHSQSALIGLVDAGILDPTAGGGSIPFEAARLGLRTMGNDLNPVAALIERATIEFPLHYGLAVKSELLRLGKPFVERVRARLAFAYPKESADDLRPDAYIWARTIRCPHCEGIVPFSPNWRLAPDGTGVRLNPKLGTGPGDASRHVLFEIVKKTSEQSAGTVSGGDGTCPFKDCGRLISGDVIKAEAQAGRMGEQLYAVVFKRRIETITKSGKRGKDKWERGYRSPRPEDDVSDTIAAVLAEKLPEWEAMDMVPTEKVPQDINDDRPIQYGMPLWRDLFSPRQLLGHATAVEVFRQLLDESKSSGNFNELTQAAFAYLALCLDKMLNYNSRMSIWMSTREVIANTFNRHDFAFAWSHAEMAPLIVGMGYDWAIEQTAKCIGELVHLVRPDAAATEQQASLGFEAAAPAFIPPKVVLTCKSGDSLDHIADASIDAVVMDPPYYDNVMYAELSDFFYVWLKRTAGYVYPELFLRTLTDKENEAVANPAKFKDQKGAKELAGRDYQQRMAAIFSEMRRVLKPDGIMTLMFTHKATGAWDALTKGLLEAGFTITASWPINTEAEGSLHIKDKSAANSTVFLVCRPRAAKDSDNIRYWEDIEPTVRQAVRQRIAQFQQAGIRGVDLYLSCFGPALEAFSQHWPLKRGTPRQDVEQTRRRKRQSELFQEAYDPYAVTPEDALDVARREVKDWRLNQLTHVNRNVELDGLTSWFVLAWDAFEAPVFPYDEANRLAKVCGIDLDRTVVGRLAEKKGSDLVLWDSVTRAAKGSLGLPDGRDSMMDALHHLARLTRSGALESANELLAQHSLANDAGFLLALEAVLEVLPVGKDWCGLDLPDAAKGAGADFDALEKLRRLALAEKIAEPEQLKIWQEDATSA